MNATSRRRCWQGWHQVIATGRSRYGAQDLLNVPSQHRDGTPLSVEFTIHPVPGPDGTVRGIAATLRDATARFHQLRELRRKLTALEGTSDNEPHRDGPATPGAG